MQTSGYGIICMDICRIGKCSDTCTLAVCPIHYYVWRASH